jgi:DMSO/TMAO reductase YedYZ molybdopterin-dependent catalytic subunit
VAGGGGNPVKVVGPGYPEDVAARIPPGQRLVKGWPVLHYGPIPRFDESAWDLEVFGLVESPYRLTYAELKALGPARVRADMHCVTGWTTLDNEWEGIPFRVLAERAGPKPEAAWVIAHCEHGYTSNLSLPAMIPAPAGGPEALWLEERQVAAGRGAHGHQRAGLLGGPRLPHPRRSLA